MSNLEEQLNRWVQKHITLISASIILILTLLLYLNFGLHFNLMSVPSTDFKGTIDPWWNQIVAEGTAKALHAPVGDYPMSYQALLVWMTKWNLGAQGANKLIWSIADLLIAVAISWLVVQIKVDNNQIKEGYEACLVTFLVPFSTILLLPSVLLNTMVWGQCDALYAMLISLALLLLYNDNWRWSIFLLGVALSYKFEAIMILPFFIMAYLLQNPQKHSVFNFMWLIVGYYLPYIPAFMHGYSLLGPLTFNLRESGEYPALSLAAPNFAQLFTVSSNTQDTNAVFAYDIMHQLLIVLTLMILAAMLLFLLRQHYDLKSNFLEIATWVVWTCFMFLPAMHERYDYLVGILLVGLGCKKIKCIPLLVTVITIDTITYMNSFFNFNPNFVILSIIMLIAYGFMTYDLITLHRKPIKQS